MSAGRVKGDSLDRYDTPPDVTRAFLNAWRPDASQWETIYEPAAGRGAMIMPLRERFPDPFLWPFDIEPRSCEVMQKDALTLDGSCDLFFTNPPFNLAMEFAQTGLRVTSHGGYVVLLLRLAFLESQKRAPWLRENMPEAVYVLSKRPSFDGKGTDSAAYGWFVWKKGEQRDHFEGRILGITD